MAEKKVIALQVKVDTSEVDENVERTTANVEDLGTATKKTSGEMKSGFKAAEQGTKGLGSSIGGLIKALGIVGVAMAVFTFMKDILSKNQKVMDALNTATTALEILFQKLLESVEPIGKAMSAAFEDPKQAVKDLWTAIKENFINRLEGVILAVQAAGRVIDASLRFDWDEAKEGAEDFGSALIQVGTGLDAEQQKSFVDGVKDFAKEVATATVAAVKQADALVQLRNAVELADVARQKAQLTAQKEAEAQRQIRDDISKTVEERIAANDEIKRILDEQIVIEKQFAQQKLDLANAEIAASGETTELLKQRGEAELALLEIEERVESQRSEQLTNQKALEKELFDLQQEIRVATLDAREKEFEELDIYYETLAEKARLAGEDEKEIEEAKIKAIEELRDKFIKDDLTAAEKAAKEKLEAEEKIKKARIQAAVDIGSALGSIASSIENQGKAGLVASKVLGVAQIAIDTGVAISGAIAQAQSLPFPGNIAAIATGVAAVIAGITSAISTINSANVPGPTATVPSVSAATSAAAAPAFNPVTTNTTELGGAEQADLAPIQAFVVETQITGNQENVNQIEGQATFGG